MRLYEKIILVLLCTIKITYLFSGLTPDTFVLIGDGAYIKAKDLEVGDQIPIYNPKKHRLEAKEIINIAKHKAKELIAIEADNNKIIVGENQKLYSRKNEKFIPAKDFNIEDMLLSLNEGNLTITNVEKIKLNETIELYDISIKDGSILLIRSDKKAHILVLDKALPIEIFTPKFFGELLSLTVTTFVATTIIAGSCCIEQTEQIQKAGKKIENDSKLDGKTTDKINSLDTTITDTCKPKATQQK